MAYSVHRVPGLSYARYRRGVAFLQCSEDTTIDAKAVFENLDQKNRQDMLNRFEYWQRGGIHDRYFHGFNEARYRACFVFKRKEAGTYHRFYGFLINPRVLSDPGYLVCVLAKHAQKNREETDPSELDGMNTLRSNKEIVAAVKRAFPENG